MTSDLRTLRERFVDALARWWQPYPPTSGHSPTTDKAAAALVAALDAPATEAVLPPNECTCYPQMQDGEVTRNFCAKHSPTGHCAGHTPPSEPSPAPPIFEAGRHRELELHLADGEIQPLEYAHRGTTAALKKLEASHEEMAERVRRAVEKLRKFPFGVTGPDGERLYRTEDTIAILEGRDKEGATGE